MSIPRDNATLRRLDDDQLLTPLIADPWTMSDQQHTRILDELCERGYQLTVRGRVLVSYKTLATVRGFVERI